MRRGDIVIASVPGNYGKPRPCLVVQSDLHNASDSVLICQFTTELRPAPLVRFDVAPDEINSLRDASQLMMDKLFAMPRDKCSAPIGVVSPAQMAAIYEGLMFVLGLLDPPR